MAPTGVDDPDCARGDDVFVAEAEFEVEESLDAEDNEADDDNAVDADASTIPSLINSALHKRLS